MRMQEGLISLMQMAKMSAAIERLHQAHLLYVVVITDPTMGGTLASFASLGDVILAEPRAQMGFAGSRVILNLRTTISARAHTSEFAHEHGMVDAIVPREHLRNVLARLLAIAHPDGVAQLREAADA